MNKNYKKFIKLKEWDVDETQAKINELTTKLTTFEWEVRLTYEQWQKYMGGDLNLHHPLNNLDWAYKREFNYYFSVGTIVKLDVDIMTDEQKEEFKDVLNLHAVVTKCYSDFHAFGRGSVYLHQLKFENGMESPRKPLMFRPTTFEPWGQIPTYLIIPISEDERKYYEKEFENRTPYQNLWWYVKNSENG